jgi:hypothetical protein
MTQTIAFLRSVILPDIADIMYSYFAGYSDSRYDLAKNGEWESAITHFGDWNTVLLGACAGGYIELAQFAVAHKANIRDSCLCFACHHGHANIVEYLIEIGACDWESGLWGACSGGHIEIARLMIAHGACDWNHGLWGACRGGIVYTSEVMHKELARLMIECGATACDCGRPLAYHQN